MLNPTESSGPERVSALPSLWDSVFENKLGGKGAKMLYGTGQFHLLVDSCPLTERLPVPAHGLLGR